MRNLLTRHSMLGLLLLLAACGGASAPATDGADSNDGAGGEATAAPPANGGGAVGDLDDFCLNTDEEVSAALDVEVTESVSTPNPGFGGGCLYSDADGGLVHAIAVVPGGAQSRATLDAARDGEGAETIDGIGDDAVLISAQGPLAILKGDLLISIGAAGPSVPIASDAAAFRAALEELGRQAVGRLP